MNQSAKRILSFVLCMAMMVGMMPMFAIGADAAETVLDAAIFCSDVHGNPSTVTSVFNGIKSADPTFDPTTAAFVGDTQTTASSVTSAAQQVYSDVQCIYAFGNHDDEGSYGIDSFTGLSYGSSDTNYYIYTISENDMSSSNPDTTGFTSTVAGLDKTKPLFIISHMPLHARRNDNNGAAAWYDAISAAANSMDIFFFWAHNHTSEGSADTAAYYVAKNGSETMSIQGGSTVTPNFTYANAGYIDPPNTPARNNVATAVRIYDDSVNLTVYNASGELSGTYAVNETVTRQFAGSTEESTDPSTDPSEETTDPSEEATEPSTGETQPETSTGETKQDVTLGGTTTTKKTVYVLTSSISSGNSYLIVNGNSAGSYYALARNGSSVAATGVTVQTDSSIGTYIELDDATDELWTTSGSSSTTLKNGSYYLYPRTKDGGSLELNTSSRNWTYSNNRLSYKKDNSNYYLYYSNGWDISTTQNSVYFYVPTEVEITVNAQVTYSVSAENVEHIYTTGAENTENISASVLGNGTAVTDLGGSYSYSVVSDESGIISGDIASDGTVTFTGKTGSAQVRVCYTFEKDGTTYEIWNTITVTATYPYYTVDITHNADGTGAEGATTDDYVSVDEVISIKGVESGDTYDLWAKVYENGAGDPVTVDSSKLTWSTNNSSVISQTADGNIVFTGNEGTAQVTVYYAYTNNDGETVQATDTVTFSVSKSTYVIPSDGTKDFPEYPDQGSIRIDKTGVALGNFSQTGIAQMELSMTGVPYGTSAKTDVVIMVDMTASMSNDDVTAAESAVKELIETLVYDEENDKYDSNIQLFVDVFYSASDDSSFKTEEYLNNVTISSATELTAATGKIDFTQSSNGGGTRYNLAMADVYETLNRDGHADNQFVVFVSDGVATAYAPLTDGELGTTITGSNSETSSLCAGWFDSTGEVTSSFKTEYYSYMIKTAGIPIYTVGANLTALSDAADLLNHMSSNYSADGKTATGETKYSFFCTTSEGITDTVLEIFTSIGQDIKEAATNVVVEDKIADEYTMNFALPSGVTADEATMSDFYIQAVSYELDENNERKADPTVIEKFLFASNGTITHTIGTTACGDTCDHVTYDTDGKVSKIDGTYFDYERTVGDDGQDTEIITWTAEKLDRKELALQYFLYLDNSAGDVEAADQVAPGTYDTNAYAHITYTNHLGTECRQYFPVPSLTWKGAKVTYVFYLVNEAGQPVNRAGKVIPFAEAVYVTDPVTYDVTWNEIEGQENLLAKNLMASAGVPDVYSLYDTSASYVIRVYETEGVDTAAKNGNYFEIGGATDKLIDSAMDTDTTADNSTTKVFNTKAGVKYDEYGVYSIYATGTELTTGTDEDGNATYTTTTVQATDIDYANTTVAFAVVWKPELTPDTVVIDYGLDVIIDVYENDGLAAGVTGVSLTAPSGVEMNKGTYADGQKVGSDSITDTDGIWTATKESLTSVRFSLDKDKGMQFDEPAVFYYEAGVNYYTYSGSTATLNTTNMYSSVTVIPATTIYYEDEYVTLKTYTSTDANGETVYTETPGWTTNSTAVSAVQQQDRPGESQISAALDADNNYGYDAAYASQSQYSMGGAAMAKVNTGVYATAEFEFYGTGFDIISLTDTTTGVILVDVYDAQGEMVLTETVNNYYGYARTYYAVTYTYDAETQTWTAAEEEVTAPGESETAPENPADGATYTVYETRWEATAANDPNALYQVPVLKIGDGDTTEVLPYGKYRAVITATYMSFFDKNKTDEGYDFYLDAIRVYNPTGNLNEDANKAYADDGEGWPTYQELRNLIITADEFNALEDDTSVSGIVFIDGGDTASVTDYISYGPNNELYLESGNAVAFDLTATAAAGEIAKIQLAVKTVGGTGSIQVYSVGDDSVTALNQQISTATDMYFDITALNGKTVVIRNTGAESDAIISITNVKITYTAAQPTANDDSGVAVASVEETAEPVATFSIRRSSASSALLSMQPEEEVEEETTEPETEATEPETTEPETEATEPETTEPEAEATEPETEETTPETTEPEGDNTGSGSVIVEIIKKLLGWIFG